MEKNFDYLQEQLKLAIVTQPEGQTANSNGSTLLYNGYANFDEFYSNIDKYVSNFFSYLNSSRGHLPESQFDLYNDLLRRWRSIKPYFRINDNNGVIGHNGLVKKVAFSDQEYYDFILPCIEIQYNTYKKVEEALRHKLEFLKGLPSLNPRIENPMVRTLKAGKSYNSTYKFHSFKFKDEARIKSLYTRLQNNGYLVNRDYKAFYTNFSGQKVNERIFWRDSNQRLNYLIKLLKNSDLIEDYRRKKDELIVKCFCDKNGNDFNEKQFKGAADPLDASKFDEIISFIELD